MTGSNTLALLAALQARAMVSPDCRLDTHAIQAAATETLYLTTEEQAMAAIILSQWRGETLNPTQHLANKEITEMYAFTEEQLRRVLYGTIEMFLEYRDVHGRTEDRAVFPAVNEVFEGLDAERELVATGEGYNPTLQIIPAAEPSPSEIADNA